MWIGIFVVVVIGIIIGICVFMKVKLIIVVKFGDVIKIV